MDSKHKYLKGIHFGSYWMGVNDVICLMPLDLKDLCDFTLIDTHIYSGNKEGRYKEDCSHSYKRPIRWLNERKVLELAKKEKPDFVMVNSGGMSLTPKAIKDKVGIEYWPFLVELDKWNSKKIKREPLSKEFRKELEEFFIEDQELLRKILKENGHGEKRNLKIN